MTRRKILFVMHYPPFIQILKKHGYDITVIHECSAQITEKIHAEEPDLIIFFMDGLEYNGIDPVQYVPECFRERVLTVSSVIRQSDLLRMVLQYFNCHIHPLFLKAM
jgi:hypothetical protein